VCHAGNLASPDFRLPYIDRTSADMLFALEASATAYLRIRQVTRQDILYEGLRIQDRQQLHSYQHHPIAYRKDLPEIAGKFKSGSH
jgi:hypothetical protein